MPVKCVKTHRRHFKHRYTRETIGIASNRLVELPAHYEYTLDTGEKKMAGFKDYTLNVDLSEERQTSGKFISVCTVWEDTKNPDLFHGLIQVCPGFSKLPIDRRKFILAHEWLHIMNAFRNKKPFKLVSRKIDMIMMFYSCTGFDTSKDAFLKELKGSYWKDSVKVSESFRPAIRGLLVSKESISEILSSEFGMTWKTFFAKLSDSSESWDELLIPLITAFSSTTGTSAKLAFDRIREMLFEYEELSCEVA